MAARYRNSLAPNLALLTEFVYRACERTVHQGKGAAWITGRTGPQFPAHNALGYRPLGNGGGVSLGDNQVRVLLEKQPLLDQLISRHCNLGYVVSVGWVTLLQR